MTHTDRGSQCTSADYGQALDDHHVLASVGSVGDAYDNALAESFVDTFKTELIADRVWRTRAHLELAVVEYVSWFNHVRLREALGDIPPVEFEALAGPPCETLTMTTSSRPTTNPVSVEPCPAQFDRASERVGRGISPARCQSPDGMRCPRAGMLVLDGWLTVA